MPAHSRTEINERSRWISRKRGRQNREIAIGIEWHTKAEVLTNRSKTDLSMISRRWIVLIAGVAVLVVITAFIAASPAEEPSVTAQSIQDISDTLFTVALPVTLLTEAFLFYAIWRFRKNDTPTPTVENRRLEISWTVATAVILLFVGVSAYAVMGQSYVTPTENTVEQQIQQGDPVVVNVTGTQWFWEFTYPQHNVTTRDELVLPANRSIVLRITATDVVHSVHIPKLGLKKDALPGKTTYLSTKLSSSATGNTYTLFCAEYCGVDHANMLADVRIVTQKQYQDWLTNQGASSSNRSRSAGHQRRLTAVPAAE